MKTDRAAAKAGVTDPREGSVLMIVVCMIGVLAMSGVTMTWMTGNTAKTARTMQSTARALSIAEAGVADMLTKLSTNYYYWQTKAFATNYDGGYFSVSNLLYANGHILISSSGTYGDETRVTTLELLGDQYSAWRALMGSYGGIIAGGDVFLRTAALTVNGGVRCNKSITHANGTPTINGDLAAVGTISYTALPGFSAVPNAPAIVVPNYLPFDPWLKLATNGGLYYGGNMNFIGANLNPSNGVVYVNGNVTFSTKPSSIRGTLVATGSITVDNRLAQTPYNTAWPSLLAGTDINENNLNSYVGVMFAGNNINIINRRDIRGCLIALNNVTVENGTTISPPIAPPAFDPTNTNNPPPDILIGGWLK